MEEGKEEGEEKKDYRWWDPSEENTFAHFCQTTSIHGLQYLGSRGYHFGERVVWLVVFIISAAASVWLIKQVFDKYVDTPVIVTFQSSEMSIGEVPFPAVTLCNMNRVLKSKANQYIKLASQPDNDNPGVQRARRNVYYMNHVCSVSNKPFSRLFNYNVNTGGISARLLNLANLTKDDEDVEDVVDFLRKASQECPEMIKLCRFQGERMDCSEVFRPIETNFGQCCTFNMVPQTILNVYTNDSRDTEDFIKRWNITGLNKIEDYFVQKNSYPRHQNRAGQPSGLMILADAALDEYFCTSSDSVGFRLSVHFPTDVPHVTDFGIAIRPNYEHYITITPSIIRTQEVVRSYSLEKRQCYFEDEFKLKYYNFYSASNCIDECVANYTYENCNCVRYYMPRDDSRDICRPVNFTCADNVTKSFFKSGMKEMCKQCLPTCTEVTYSASTTMAPLQRLIPWYTYGTKRSPWFWENRNVSIINVFFSEDSIYAKERGQLYGITDLIANTGGLLGLCMGFSLLSFFEIIYHIAFRPWCQRKKKFQPPTRCMNGSGVKCNGGVVETRSIHIRPEEDSPYPTQKFEDDPPPYLPRSSFSMEREGNGKSASRSKTRRDFELL